MNATYLRYSIILGILTAFGPICTDFYLPALPQISSDLHTSVPLSQLSLTAALIGLGIGQLFFGPWSDRIGRKKPLMLALALFTLSSIGCMFVQDITQMVMIRFIQGFAGAGGAVLARAIASDRYAGKELAQFFALIMAINGIAPILSPVLGGIQLQFTEWQGLFASLSILGIAIFLLCYFFITESHSPNRVEQLQQSVKLAFTTVLKDRVFIGLCLIQSMMMGGLFAYIGASSYVFQENYHFSALSYSLLFAVNGCGLIIAAIATSKLLNYFSEKKLLMMALGIALVTSLGLLIVSALHAPILLCLSFLFITISTVSCISSLTSALAMQRQHEFSGTASALLGFLMFAIGGVTAPLTTLFGTSLLSMSTVIFMCYVLAGLSYLITFRTKIQMA
ncbi:multidrug effflux MFS transporter [Acinetobacter nosocomialis]|uniref:multidrug effflux MFS transporter n=1 Tax=Acinetobacter TaxID=469 RepID=UPI000B3E232A|nr:MULTISPECIES: multidrug effflux MFS transporter [Acinetobacter]MCZ3210830.1 multidrug effflux MFS transporter [Acinetobacter baumannii]MCZ3293470.1 multidrug effflux MFS transporter [Acinetobacter baumannii]MDQ9042470.1 multidrug effflux MFS transporter [Acinetobacter nosocomialis]MDQ9905762.1 multidrug effflux MFS transporter [Acinetobacter sp. 148]MDR9527110.1 multidrug effflux MFS transporter [Acinetobacter baumannii]